MKLPRFLTISLHLTLVISFTIIFAFGTNALISTYKLWQQNRGDILGDLTTSVTVYICGDSFREGTEICDGPDFGGRTCTSLGYQEGTLSCTTECTLDTSSCVYPSEYCGNGLKEPGELCDQLDFGTLSCNVFGYANGNLTCTNTCLISLSNCANPAPSPTKKPVLPSINVTVIPSETPVTTPMPSVTSTITPTSVFSSDKDSDGLPDQWELAYYCMKVDIFDSRSDYDNDQRDNLTEFRNGTNPCVYDSDNSPHPTIFDLPETGISNKNIIIQITCISSVIMSVLLVIFVVLKKRKLGQE